MQSPSIAETAQYRCAAANTFCPEASTDHLGAWPLRTLAVKSYRFRTSETALLRRAQAVILEPGGPLPSFSGTEGISSQICSSVYLEVWHCESSVRLPMLCLECDHPIGLCRSFPVQRTQQLRRGSFLTDTTERMDRRQPGLPVTSFASFAGPSPYLPTYSCVSPPSHELELWTLLQQSLSWSIVCHASCLFTLVTLKSPRLTAVLATMNWTEGNLARHSRASKGREVLLRQKAHFAKARAGLLNANVKISPPSISAFAHSVRSSPARSHSARSKLSATSPFQKRNRYKSPLQVSHYFRHDNSHEVPTPPDVQKDQAEVEALRQKRRKLLLKGDWTGIKLQKPIEMEFSKPRASVGGPWNHSMSRHAKSKSRMRHWLDTEYNGGQGRGPRSVVKMTAHISPNQLRVRVGSRERFFGDSSNVSPRSRTCRDIDSSPYGRCDDAVILRLLF